MSRRNGPTLADRVGLTPSDVPQEGLSRPDRAVVERHCWVRDPPEAEGRWQGLLVEWRQPAGTGAWQGRVVYVVAMNAAPVLVEAWLPADLLSPR